MHSQHTHSAQATHAHAVEAKFKFVESEREKDRKSDSTKSPNKHIQFTDKSDIKSRANIVVVIRQPAASRKWTMDYTMTTTATVRNDIIRAQGIQLYSNMVVLVLVYMPHARTPGILYRRVIRINILIGHLVWTDRTCFHAAGEMSILFVCCRGVCAPHNLQSYSGWIS